jgi:hypothetical protein
MTSDHGTPTYPSKRLALALWAVVVATALVLVVAVLRAGSTGLAVGVVRVVLLALLTVLVLRGQSWARWVLVAWLGLATLLFVGNLLAALDYPIVFILFTLMIGLHGWAMLELVKADIAGPAVKSV